MESPHSRPADERARRSRRRVVRALVSRDGRPKPDPCRCSSRVRHRVSRRRSHLRHGMNIRGMNTAATLWCAAAVGCLAGAGIRLGAVPGCIHRDRHERRASHGRPSSRSRTRHWHRDRTPLPFHRRIPLRSRGVRSRTSRSGPAVPVCGLRSIRSNDLPGGDRAEIRAGLVLTGGNVRTTLENAVGRLSLEPTLKLVGWERIEDASDLEIGSNSPHRRKLRRRQNPDGDLMRSNIDPEGKNARHDPGG